MFCLIFLTLLWLNINLVPHRLHRMLLIIVRVDSGGYDLFNFIGKELKFVF